MMHYQRLRKHGDPMKNMRGAPRAILEAVIASDTDQCIEWPFAKARGYGQISLNGKNVYAHRVVLERTAGLPPTPIHCACHAPVICHNRACVNPRHLRWATPAENKGDCLLDGMRGVKLTVDQVLAIRADPRFQHQIASEFGIDQTNVSQIKTRKTWQHLGEQTA